MNRPIVTLTTDFGDRDYFVAAMKGVILSIAPEAQVVDVTHQITAFGIEEAAFLVDQASRCYPKKTVHVVVVDPGVGSARRPILVQNGGQNFVGPDNGVFGMILAREKCTARELTVERYFRKPVSQTFHGRDIFAPVAAHLARGVAAAKFGKTIEDAFRPALQAVQQTGKRSWCGAVLTIDRFGNIVTNFSREQFPALGERPFDVKVGFETVMKLADNYAAMPFGELFGIWGSAGYLEIVLNQGHAAKQLGVGVGAPVELVVY